MTPEHHLVLVVGIGRSGTSAFTHSLSEFGYVIPPPEVRPNRSNPRGFAEPRWAVEFHKVLLREAHVANFDARPEAFDLAAAVCTDDRCTELATWLRGHLADNPRLVVKDPRTVWFLPMWIAAAKAVGVRTSFITMLRPPAEVVSSATQWYSGDGIGYNRLSGWINVMLRIEQATRGTERAYASYPALLRDWHAELTRVDRALGLGLDLADQAAAERITSWLDPTLRRQHATLKDLEATPPIRRMATAVWSALEALREDPMGDGQRTRLDRLQASYLRYRRMWRLYPFALRRKVRRRAYRVRRRLRNRFGDRSQPPYDEGVDASPASEPNQAAGQPITSEGDSG